MSSRSSSSSCLGSAILILVGLILIRYGLPKLWLILAALFSTAFYGGLIIFLMLIVALGVWTYRNFQRNKQPKSTPQQERVVRVQQLYKSLTDRLQRESLLNDISAEEFLQSEILVSQTLNDLQSDLARLKEVASPQNVSSLNQQVYEYKKEMQATSDASVKQVIEENLKLLEDRRTRMARSVEEIRQKEASVDLVYHSLLRAEEEMNLGKAVKSLLPAEVYQRFGITPPRQKESLPPLVEKSSGTE